MSELPEELTKGRYHFQLREDDAETIGSRSKPSASEARRRENRRQIERILEDRELKRQFKDDLM